MENNMEEIFKKFFYTPGLCNLEEILIIKKYFQEYYDKHELLIKCGMINFNEKYLDSIMDKIDWYIDFQSKKEN